MIFTASLPGMKKSLYFFPHMLQRTVCRFEYVLYMYIRLNLTQTILVKDREKIVQDIVSCTVSEVYPVARHCAALQPWTSHSTASTANQCVQTRIRSHPFYLQPLRLHLVPVNSCLESLSRTMNARFYSWFQTSRLPGSAFSIILVQQAPTAKLILVID